MVIISLLGSHIITLCLTWQTTCWALTNHVFHNVIRREVLQTDILEQHCKQTRVLWMILTACVWKKKTKNVQNKKRRLNFPGYQSSENHPSSMLLCLQWYREDQSLLRSISNIWNISFVLAGKDILTCFLSLVLCVRLSVRTSYSVPNEPLVRHPTSAGLRW